MFPTLHHSRLRRDPRLIGLLLALTFIGCSPVYLIRSAAEEARILWNRRPIEELLKQKDLDPKLRDRLILAEKVREYSRDVLKLRVKGNYASYSPGRRKRLLTVISASLRIELKPYSWWFPVVGRVPYKGFFDRERAMSEANKLEKNGYDVHLTESDAFSTLGWFDDPIQSQFLRYDRVGYVDLLIHELFHSTMYIPNEAGFNEASATFAGRRGAIAFFQWYDGEESGSYRKAVGRWKDSLKFSVFLGSLLAKLRSLYKTPMPMEEKLARKEEILSASREELKALHPTLRSNEKRFLDTKLNNAVLLHYWLYVRNLALFEKMYGLLDQDLPRALVRIQECGQAKGDPFGRLEEFVHSASDARAFTP